MIEWRDDDSALLDDETKIGRIEYAFFVYGRFVPTARVAEMRQLKTGSVRPRLIATDSRRPAVSQARTPPQRLPRFP